MSARKELLGYLATCTATVVGLFGLQFLYESYLDVHVVHAEWDEAPMDPALREQRDAIARKLQSGNVPLERAKELLASRGHAFSSIEPKSSDDLSAMSGWVRNKEFSPYVPRSAAEEGADEAETTGEEASATEGAPTDTDAAESAGAEEGAAADQPGQEDGQGSGQDTAQQQAGDDTPDDGSESQ